MRTLILDTETTALVSNSVLAEEHQPEIIEFFGHILDEDTGDILEELEFYAKPKGIIPEEVTKITGIKPEDVANEPPFAEYAERVLDFIGSVGRVVAHNLSYDKFVIDQEIKRRDDLDLSWPDDLICTVEQTEHLLGYRLNLSALHEYLFGETFPSAHRARADVEALTRCYKELVKQGEI